MSESPRGGMRNGAALSGELENSRRLAARFCQLELQFANAILDHATITRGPHHAESVARARSVRDGLAHILEHLHQTREAAAIVESGLAQLDRRIAEEDAGEADRQEQSRPASPDA